jgi:2-keto-4-pentenoate hydratase
MTCSPGEIDSLADRILAASDAGSAIEPITDTMPGFSLEDAYRVSARIIERRTARGERPIGWKIGFTNRTIWDEYGVHAPIWAPMYDSTVEGTEAPALPVLCSLFRLVEPRIEPEIIFRIATPPRPDMEAAELLSCLDAVAHGFEIVQSLFPDWRFRAPDTVAAFALHGRLRHGPFVRLEADQDRAEWLEALTRFEIVLAREGVVVDRGAATNVLDGPLFALRHFVQGLVADPHGRGLQAGDLVSTGTITRAFPVHPGETWRSEVVGLPLPGMSIAFF